MSRLELENLAVGHPDVKEACVIGVKHAKWDERPLLLVIKEQDSSLTEEQMLAFFDNKVATWWAKEEECK